MENRKSYTQDITEKRFHDLLFLFRIGGIPLYMKSVSKIRSIYNIIMSLCFYSLYVSEWLEVYYSTGLKNTMKTLRMVVPITILFFMELIFRFRVGTFNELLKMTEMFVWEDLPQRNSKTGHVTFAGWIPRIKKIVRRVIIISTGFYTTHRLVSAVAKHELMYPGWYPLDTSSSPQFEIVYFTQMLATLLLQATFYGFLYLYTILVFIACSQLDHLNANILRIQQKKSSSSKEMKSCSESEYELQKELNECIRHHQKIIRYLETLETTMNIPMLVILLILLITMCTVAFSVITSMGDVVDMCLGVYTYMLMIMLVFTYCILGSLLTQKFESVRDAAWSSDWVGTPVSYQRCILFVIAKSNKTFTLTAGKFVPVCNSTMMNMLNQSLSFFMFLLTMKDKNEELKQ
ncbi:odorant receptor 2a-like [Periplaneta americana]|uniref:odorant receptor 2a-like n=1 Tax=Periplaneta americana TaxID=6978 RepID=UPI0037E77D70